MKYYESEPRRKYREIERRGLSAWNELHGEPGFDFSLHPFLNRVLPSLAFDADRPTALEIGCGTGACCCYLAEQRFDVTGLDVEPKAIELARSLASDRGHTPSYEVADICQHDAPRAAFDLVVDGHCLECIVLDDDRQRVFAAVRAMLREDGYYIIGTTVWNPDRDYGDDHVDHRTGIVYASITTDGAESQDAKMIGESWYLPNRRHMSPERLRDEITSAGFDVLQQRAGDLLCRQSL